MAKLIHKPFGLFVSVVKAVMDRAGATGFARLTGAWPGETKD